MNPLPQRVRRNRRREPAHKQAEAAVPDGSSEPPKGLAEAMPALDISDDGAYVEGLTGTLATAANDEVEPESLESTPFEAKYECECSYGHATDLG